MWNSADPEEGPESCRFCALNASAVCPASGLATPLPLAEKPRKAGSSWSDEGKWEEITSDDLFKKSDFYFYY